MSLSSAPKLSSGLVTYLRGRGKTLRQIGQMVGLSESFISRVAKGERCFTLDHLCRFERALGESIPVLVMESVWGRDLDAKQRPEYEKVLGMLRGLAGFGSSVSEAGEPKKRRPVATAPRRKTRRAAS